MEAKRPRGRPKKAVFHPEMAKKLEGWVTVKIRKPVWLANHKAQPGEVATLEAVLADKLIASGHADAYRD